MAGNRLGTEATYPPDQAIGFQLIPVPLGPKGVAAQDQPPGPLLEPDEIVWASKFTFNIHEVYVALGRTRCVPYPKDLWSGPLQGLQIYGSFHLYLTSSWFIVYVWLYPTSWIANHTLDA